MYPYWLHSRIDQFSVQIAYISYCFPWCVTQNMFKQTLANNIIFFHRRSPKLQIRRAIKVKEWKKHCPTGETSVELFFFYLLTTFVCQILPVEKFIAIYATVKLLACSVIILTPLNSATESNFFSYSIGSYKKPYLQI